MSIFERAPAEPAGLGRGGDDIEGLLREFFRAEMPDPWPAFRTPEDKSGRAAPVRVRRWALLRSRFALAASLALLAGGHLLLANSLPGEDADRDSAKRRDVVASTNLGKPQPAHGLPGRSSPDGRREVPGKP